MFCKYCGKELSDEAIVCPGCGCLARDSYPEETPNVPPVAPVVSTVDVEAEKRARIKSGEKQAKLFSILAFIFLCVEFFFLCAHIADALQFLLGTIYYHDTGAAAVAFLFSWAALAMGITAFVCGVKIKWENAALRTITIFVFVASIVAFIIPIVFMSV